MHGTTEVDCKNGTCVFEYLTIKDPGNYYFDFNFTENKCSKLGLSSPIDDLTSQSSFALTSEQAHIPFKSFKINLPQEDVIEYLNSEVNVLLYDFRSELLQENYTIDLKYSSDHVGPQQVLTDNGNLTFKYYFKDPGNSSISLSSPHFSHKLNVKIERVIST